MPHRLFDLIQSIKKGCVKTEEHIREAHDLSTAEFNGLLIIDSGEHILGGEFSDRMGLSPSRGSRVINQLVQKGLFQTEPIPENRRAIKVFMTPSGRQLRETIDKEIEQCEERMISQIPEEHREEFKKTLNTLSCLLNNPS